MSYEKEINNKAQELGQKYFPNHLNIWARPNVESHHVECACIEMSEYVKKKMIDKACEWFKNNWREHIFHDADGMTAFIGWEKDFRKAMEE